ncbi:hypothetical protein EXIGLDRAFT_728275 [Exidia glandulosa HHB12029]|uniref:Uncharacterized protein n=1 Tax=Exidia glandulosa HHB12029 TaxID=1314781 RepID=A0A165ZKA2_EXIGL|nr:hypothetical protein EXIGLDRAFT_728275 [Exidia glandulosa HHB12029]
MTTIFVATVQNLEICTLTGLSVSIAPAEGAPVPVQVMVTNIGVSQDPVAEDTPSPVGFAPYSTTTSVPSTSTSTSSYFKLRRAEPVSDVQRIFDAVSVSGNGGAVVPWTVDVPEGFYIATARAPDSAHAEIIASPRFFVVQGNDVSCLSASSSSSSSSTPTFATSTTDTDTSGATETSALRKGQSDSNGKETGFRFPIAGIVGVVIAAIIVGLLGVLICRWDRQRHRNAAMRRKSVNMEQATPGPVRRVSGSSSFFDRDRGSRWATTRA